MDAQQFLAEFGHIANAPDGVARLRELVLQLAISGRLVLPDGNETPIRESIERAVEQRRQYERDNGLRPTHNRKLASAIPYSIPQHWQWEALENLALYIQRGKSPKYAESGKVRVVSQKCVQWAGFDVTPARYIADDSLHAYGDERFVRGGDLLWNSTGTGTVGRVAICETHQETYCVADSHVTVVRLSDTVLPRYLWCVIASPWIQMRFQPTHPDSLVSGTTQQVEFSTSSARSLPIPVPPLDEQTRIVAKVDELMALCDKLEDEQQKRRKLQNTLRQATLQAVAKAQRPQELQASWARLEANFGRLFSAPEDVRSIRDVVFDLALRGALVPDGRLVSMAGQASDELPPLPEDWEWKTLEMIAEYITSGSRGWKSYMTSTGDAFIRSQDIKHDALVFENPAYVTLPERTEGKRTLVRRGDLLLTITGGNVGKCAVVPAMDGNAYVSQHVALIRLNEPCLSEYVHFWMINIFGGRGFLARYIYGDKPGLNLTQVGSVPIPVPPKAQAESILKSLIGYRASFELMETQLRAKQELASALAQATVSSLTGIAIEQEEESVKVPQTELISRLRLGQAPGIKAQAPLASLLARQNGELSAQDLWQRYGGEIDAFYAQLKIEVAHGWIEDPSYELDESAPDGPKKYPHGSLVAKVLTKEDA